MDCVHSKSIFEQVRPTHRCPSISKVVGASGSVFAGQAVSIKEVHDDIWLVSFVDYDLGYVDLDTRVLEPLDNPFGPRLLPM